MKWFHCCARNYNDTNDSIIHEITDENKHVSEGGDIVYQTRNNQTKNPCFTLDNQDTKDQIRVLKYDTTSIVLHSPKEENTNPVVLSPIVAPSKPLIRPSPSTTRTSTFKLQSPSHTHVSKPLSPRVAQRLATRQRKNNLNGRTLSIHIPNSASPPLEPASSSLSITSSISTQKVYGSPPRSVVFHNEQRKLSDPSLVSIASSSTSDIMNFEQFLMRLVRYDARIRSICPEFKNYWDKNYISLFNKIQTTLHSIDAEDVTVLAKKAICLKNSVRCCAKIEFKHYGYDHSTKTYLVDVLLTFGNIKYENHTKLQKWDNTNLLLQEIKQKLPKDLLSKMLETDLSKPDCGPTSYNTGNKTTCSIRFPIMAKFVNIAIDEIITIWQSYQFPLAFYLVVDYKEDNIVMCILFELRPYIPNHHLKSPLSDITNIPKLDLDLDTVSSSPLYRDPVKIKGKCSRSLLQSPACDASGPNSPISDVSHPHQNQFPLTKISTLSGPSAILRTINAPTPMIRTLT